MFSKTGELVGGIAKGGRRLQGTECGIPTLENEIKWGNLKDCEDKPEGGAVFEHGSLTFPQT